MIRKVIPSNYFQELYFDNKKSFLDEFEFYDKVYDKSMQYFDETRKSLNRLKTKKQIVAYTMMFNISSSLCSYIKNQFLGIRTISDALLIRNIIESIIIYSYIFKKNKNKDKYIAGFFKHYIVQEMEFRKIYFEKLKKEKIKDIYVKQYISTIDELNKLYGITSYETTERIFKKRMGWTYGLLRKKSYVTMSTLVKNSNYDICKKIYFGNNLNSIIHLEKQKSNIEFVQKKKIFNLCLKVLGEIEKETGIKIKRKSNKQLRLEYSRAYYEQKVADRIEPIMEKLDKLGWYKQKIRNLNETDILKNLLRGNTRFEFESISYAGGFVQPYYHYLLVFEFIFDFFLSYGDERQKNLVSTLIPLIKAFKTDLAFGFHNEYKITFRYLVDYILLLFFNKRFSRNIMKHTENMLEKIAPDKMNSQFIFSIYFESSNFVHPNVYGYYGEFSNNTKYIFDYQFSIERLLNYSFSKMMYPLSSEIISETSYFYSKLIQEYYRCYEIFSKFSFNL